MFVNTLNSSATRMSYPYDDRPYDTTPPRTWFSTNGSIMRCSFAMRLIHESALIDIDVASSVSSPERNQSQGQPKTQADPAPNSMGRKK